MAPDRPDPPDDGEPTTPATPTTPAAASEAAGGRAPSDLRVKDLVGKSRDELEQELDPATLAELASWFARPNILDVKAREVPDEVTAGRARDLDDFEKLALALGAGADQYTPEDIRARAMQAVDPTMIDILDRHTRAAEGLLRARPEPPRQVVDETIVPASVRALAPRGDDDEGGISFEPRQYGIARDIEALLERDNAPQAVLRDLNRPVEEFERRLEPAFPPPPAEEDMTFAIRDALRWRPEKVPPREVIPDVAATWRSLVLGSWSQLVAEAKAVRAAEIAESDRQTQADAERGIIWRW
ncbi:MAG TPA: hypothetical protein VHE35_23085 [Kofleriaceae bacterium]|nr:hypothetical protein [Kofleriaceae bacterium]